MKLHIKGDGVLFGTEIKDLETGAQLSVSAFTISCDAKTQDAKVELTIPGRLLKGMDLVALTEKVTVVHDHEWPDPDEHVGRLHHALSMAITIIDGHRQVMEDSEDPTIKEFLQKTKWLAGIERCRDAQKVCEEIPA